MCGGRQGQDRTGEGPVDFGGGRLWAALRSQEWSGYVLGSYYYTAVNTEDSVQSADTAVSVTARTCSNCSVQNLLLKENQAKKSKFV